MLLDDLIALGFSAARIVRKVYETPFAVQYKGPSDPVTAADLSANEHICGRLAELYPGVPVVAEESPPEHFHGYRTAERVFFVDPLDGTAEFVNRNGEFVVMLGLVEEAEAVAGVVVAPAQGRAWAGRVGEGAFSITEDGQREKIHVSSTASLPDCRVVVSRSHRSPALEQLLGLIGGREVAAVGSAGLKGAEIARGTAEVYVGPGRVGKRWDVCAVDAIVTAAGGRLTDAAGKRFDYRAASIDNEHGIIATNGVVHDAVVELAGRLAR